MNGIKLLLPLAALMIAACSGGERSPAAAWTMGPDGGTPAVTAATRVIDVYKSPTCDCCHEWEAYLRRHGYTVNSIPTDDLAMVKNDRRVPREAWSCHTATIGAYVVEGHVPIEAIEDLLARRPAIDGIALPGMPPGSPGMPGTKEAPFEILALHDGDAATFGEY